MEARKKKIIGWSCISIAIIAIGITIGAMIYIITSVNEFNQVFTQGVLIEKIEVGGLTKEAAFEKITAKLEDDLQNEYIQIEDDKNKYQLSFKELGLKYPLENVIEEAFTIGHEGTLFERYKYAKTPLEEPINFEVPYVYEIESIKIALKEYVPKFYIAPTDATIQRKNRKFVITQEIAGEELNIETTVKAIESALETKAINTSIRVTMNPVAPKHTAKDLANVQSPVSSFYTSYNNADQDRNINLKVAAEKINEVLAPGETFSLAEHLEPITSAEGYRESKIIVNGRIEDGIGGGVCQIASTLYNAVLLSNLDITVRRNHSLPVAYVPLGRDATYATGGIDFRFKNNSEYPVFIESYCENNRVYVNIFSHESLKPAYDEIKFQSETIEIIEPPATKYIDDPNLPKGTEVQDLAPLEGKKVKLYKLYYKGNELIKKEVVDTSYYKPRAAIIKVGTKEVPVVKAENTTDSETTEPLSLD